MIGQQKRQSLLLIIELCVFPWNQISEVNKTTGIGQALFYFYLFILSLFNNSDGKFISYIAVLWIRLFYDDFVTNHIDKVISSVP